MVAATSHVPTIHPIVAAKQATTIDHISNGRFALNLVMGWFTPEMQMFDGTQRAHDDRYRYGAEWLTIVKRLWTEEEPFDFETADFHIRQAQAHPKPIQQPHPVLINAGHSPAATEFSAREVDFSFVGNDSLDSVRAVVEAHARQGADRLRPRHRHLHLGAGGLPRDRGRGARRLSQHPRARRPRGGRQPHEGARHREPVVQRAHREVPRARGRGLGHQPGRSARPSR